LFAEKLIFRVGTDDSLLFCRSNHYQAQFYRSFSWVLLLYLCCMNIGIDVNMTKNLHSGLLEDLLMIRVLIPIMIDEKTPVLMLGVIARGTFFNMHKKN